MGESAEPKESAVEVEGEVVDGAAEPSEEHGRHRWAARSASAAWWFLRVR
jgi:hypothetical protein